MDTPVAFPWYITMMVGAGLSVFIGFVIAGYRWMDRMEAAVQTLLGNHLPHIQNAVEKTASGVVELKAAIELHDAHEGAHYELLKDRL